ncbi:MAG: hypothetical protein ACJAXF_000925 [Polaribacter sp.]|jgi:hypothetical protein
MRIENQACRKNGYEKLGFDFKLYKHLHQYINKKTI